MALQYRDEGRSGYRFRIRLGPRLVLLGAPSPSEFVRQETSRLSVQVSVLHPTDVQAPIYQAPNASCYSVRQQISNKES